MAQVNRRSVRVAAIAVRAVDGVRHVAVMRSATNAMTSATNGVIHVDGNWLFSMAASHYS